MRHARNLITGRVWAWVVAFWPAFCGAVDHGPIVHWSEDPAKATGIVWIDKEGQANEKATEYQVEYRVKGSNTLSKAVVSSNPLAASAHEVFHSRLAGLPNGSDIEFRIVDGGKPGKFFVFRMPPAKQEPIRFVTGGDLYHNRAPMDRMNRRCGLEDPLFALIGGDLAYSNDQEPERWFDYFDSWVTHARTPDGRLIPKMVTIGNHEVGPQGYRPHHAPGPEAAREFFSLFRFPGGKEVAHVVDFGNWFSVVMLDSGHARSIRPQNEWLEKTLKARSKTPHLFVCYHQPAYGAGTKADATDIQREWSPLFERYRVTAVFENDHHNFVRSHPILKGKVDQENGIPYLGAGAWSVTPRQIYREEAAKRPWVAKAEGKNHLYVVETSATGFRATAKGFEGEVIDAYQRDWQR